MKRACPSNQVLNLQGNPWNCSCPLLNVSEDGNKTSEQTDGKSQLRSTRFVSLCVLQKKKNELQQIRTLPSSTSGPSIAPADACASLDSRAVSDFLNMTDECNQSATPDTTTDGPGTTTTTAVSQPLPSSHTAPEPAVTSQSTTAKGSRQSRQSAQTH